MQLKFKNGKFRIMQVSDAQDLQFVRPTMIRMLNKAYDTLNPDLIVLTGDNINTTAGESLTYATAINEFKGNIRF